MKDLKQTIVLDRPANEAFDFTINPANTPKWVDGIVAEETNETPTKLGTIYRNQGHDGSWREFKLTEFTPGLSFTMTEKGGDIHVRYTFKPLDDERCELEYYVWVDTGELQAPFTPANVQSILKSLQAAVVSY